MPSPTTEQRTGLRVSEDLAKADKLLGEMISGIRATAAAGTAAAAEDGGCNNASPVSSTMGPFMQAMADRMSQKNQNAGGRAAPKTSGQGGEVICASPNVMTTISSNETGEYQQQASSLNGGATSTAESRSGKAPKTETGNQTVTKTVKKKKATTVSSPAQTEEANAEECLKNCSPEAARFAINAILRKAAGAHCGSPFVLVNDIHNRTVEGIPIGPIDGRSSAESVNMSEAIDLIKMSMAAKRREEELNMLHQDASGAGEHSGGSEGKSGRLPHQKEGSSTTTNGFSSWRSKNKQTVANMKREQAAKGVAQSASEQHENGDKGVIKKKQKKKKKKTKASSRKEQEEDQDGDHALGEAGRDYPSIASNRETVQDSESIGADPTPRTLLRQTSTTSTVSQRLSHEQTLMKGSSRINKLSTQTETTISSTPDRTACSSLMDSRLTLNAASTTRDSKDSSLYSASGSIINGKLSQRQRKKIAATRGMSLQETFDSIATEFRKSQGLVDKSSSCMLNGSTSRTTTTTTVTAGASGNRDKSAVTSRAPRITSQDGPQDEMSLKNRGSCSTYSTADTTRGSSDSSDLAFKDSGKKVCDHEVELGPEAEEIIERALNGDKIAQVLCKANKVLLAAVRQRKGSEKARADRGSAVAPLAS
ncbi:unnamed protein product [Amoebophrya sp. A25]|nr:unnamed protein product [Amoebophrya sp. A25]|eukprot:GSA25T00013866001.1